VQLVRVAVLSDDRLLCEGLSRIIGGETSIEVVGCLAETAFGPALRAARPHVLLVDSRMAGVLDLCAALKRDRGPAVIFFMAARDEDLWAVAALAAGARGILAKNAPDKDLVKAIGVVQEGQIWARRQAIEAWVEHMASVSGAFRTRESSLEQGLSSREKEVFRHAATGLSNKELAGRLAISQATVKVHLTHIFQKLGLRGRAELAAAYHGIIPSTPGRSSPGQALRPS
jgi:DNA-binding NarL/FixJ family response regulator